MSAGLLPLLSIIVLGVWSFRLIKRFTGFVKNSIANKPVIEIVNKSDSTNSRDPEVVYVYETHHHHHYHNEDQDNFKPKQPRVIEGHVEVKRLH